MKETLSITSINDNSPPLPTELGPGPQKLIGFYIDPDNESRVSGYFGETSTTDLITGKSLATTVGITAGNPTNSVQPWLKFLLDGKILFVSKKSYRYSIPFTALTTANVVIGTRTLTINSLKYKVRLLKGLGPDQSYGSTGYDPIPSHGSEWNRLIYNVCIGTETYPKTSQEGGQWASFTESEINVGIGFGAYSWCQEVAASGYHANRGAGSVTRLGSFVDSQTSSNAGWRPVLELI